MLLSATPCDTGNGDREKTEMGEEDGAEVEDGKDKVTDDRDGNDGEDDEDDESDDDVKITIGDILAVPGPATYPSNFNMKRGAPGQNAQGTGEKSKVS